MAARRWSNCGSWLARPASSSGTYCWSTGCLCSYTAPSTPRSEPGMHIQIDMGAHHPTSIDQKVIISYLQLMKKNVLITNISHNRNNVLISVIYFSWRLVFVVKNTCVRGCGGSNNNVFWGRLFNAVPFEHHRKAYKLNIETIWRPLIFVTSKLLVLTEANCIKTHTGKHAHRHKHSLKCSLTCKLILCPCMYLF